MKFFLLSTATLMAITFSAIADKPNIDEIVISGKTFKLNWAPWIGHSDAWKTDATITEKCLQETISYNVSYCPDGYSFANMYLNGTAPTDCQANLESLINLMIQRCQ